MGRPAAAPGLVDSYEEYMAKNLHDPSVPNAQLAFGMLNQSSMTAGVCGVRNGAVPAPDAMGPHGSHYPFGYLHDRVALTCANQEIRCLDLLPALETIADPRTMWVSPIRRPPQPDSQRPRRPGNPPASEDRAGWPRHIG